MMQRSLHLVLVAAFLALATLPGLAQGSGQGGGPSAGTAAPPAKSFLPPQGQWSAPAPEASGPLRSLYAWLTAWQADINRRLAAAVREVRTGHPVTATLVLAALSFAYGVLHAAGPGHGKAVISSYVLAHGAARHRAVVSGGAHSGTGSSHRGLHSRARSQSDWPHDESDRGLA